MTPGPKTGPAPIPTPPPEPDDPPLGGVHIKYFAHCPRQLWLYTRGYRPEAGSDEVAYGEVVDDTTYTRQRDIDLGEARIDWVTTGAVIHETKSSRAINPAHTVQVRHYCLLLERRGVNIRGGIVHYPLVRRTLDVTWNTEARTEAQDTEEAARQTMAGPLPPKLSRAACRGCSYRDYCWEDA